MEIKTIIPLLYEKMAPLADYRTVLCGFPSTGAGFASDHPPSYSAPICKLAGQDESTSCKHGTALIPKFIGYMSL